MQEYLAQQHKQSVQSDLVTLNAASTVFDRLGEQLPARFLGSVEAACQSELEIEKDENEGSDASDVGDASGYDLVKHGITCHGLITTIIIHNPP